MDIRELAEEVSDQIRFITEDGSDGDPVADAIERAIAEAVREEREACAAIVMDPKRREEYVMMGPRMMIGVAAAIRARKP